MLYVIIENIQADFWHSIPDNGANNYNAVIKIEGEIATQGQEKLLYWIS